MYFFTRMRFKKTFIMLIAIGVLVFVAIPVRAILGASFGTGGDFSFLLIAGLGALLCTVILWLVFRGKGVQINDLIPPMTVVYLIALMLHYHITQIS